MIKNLLFLNLILTFYSCNAPTSKIKEFNNDELYKFEYSKLLGKWKSDQHFEEQWRKGDDSSLIGMAFEIEGKDTLQIDRLRIDDIDYVSKLGIAVHNHYLNSFLWFEEIKSSPQEIVFGNEKTEFPSKITYILLSNNEMQVLIEGKINGKMIVKKINYKKEK